MAGRYVWKRIIKKTKNIKIHDREDVMLKEMLKDKFARNTVVLMGAFILVVLVVIIRSEHLIEKIANIIT